MRINYKFFKTIYSCLLASCLLPALAVAPPRYLAVKDFKSCLAQQDQGSFSVWCVPAHKPKACPKASWKQLKALQKKGEMGACQVSREAAKP